MRFNKVLRKFFKAKTSEDLPQEIVNGQILYAEDENALYIDTESRRNLVNEKPDLDDVVRFGTSQSLTDSEKIQAKANIGIDDNYFVEIDRIIMESFATAENWKVRQDTGLAESDETYKIVKYEVTAGSSLQITSDGSFQFQSEIGARTEAPSNRIGTSYGAGTYTVVVPDGAIYLLISILKTGHCSVQQLFKINDEHIRFDESQNLTDSQKAQARANIGSPEIGYGVGAHNIFRGKDLGTSFTEAQSESIVNGTFDDLYVGDYWTIDGVVYRIAGVDCVYNRGDTALNKHHLVIVPDGTLYNHQMAYTESGAYEAGAANTTAGGYVTAYGRTTGLSAAQTTIVGIFGDAHVLSYRDYLSNDVTDGKASAGVWADVRIELMSEMMVYGACIRCTPSTQEVGIFTFQLPLFAQAPYFINSKRQSQWLRSVASASVWCGVYSYGNASGYSASYTLGIRPIFLIA